MITIFSQFGEPSYINLVRDKETGKSRGFAFLKYEDQRSTDLAVDNLGGAVIMGRTLKVDHTRYKKKDDEAETGIELLEEPKQIEEDESRRKRRRTSESESENERSMIREEIELAKLIQDHDEEDPMKPYLIQEKREEVALALARIAGGKKSKKANKHRNHHHKSRRSKHEGGDKDDTRRKEGHRRRSQSRERRRSGDRDVPRLRGRDLEFERADEHRIRRRSPTGDISCRDRLDRAGDQSRRREDKRPDSIHRSSH